jgi:formamidopyrimidine-DNA glycosylase
MPELPEVETTLRGVSPYLLGQEIREVIVRNPSLRWPITAGMDRLVGQRFTAGRRRGKYLLFHSEVGTLMIHLGMSGALRIATEDLPWRKHDHFALGLASRQQLRYHDPRRFGCVLLIDGDVDAHPLLAELGPEPLDSEFTVDYLVKQAHGRESSIKALIMDSKVVVGVGNIYACEALHMAGIQPTKAAGKVSRPAATRLIRAIKEVLEASIEMGGTTLRDFLRENGEPGYFKQTLRVYDRENQPCPQCLAGIRRIVQNSRSTFYCGKCQR